eukprot:sb/3479170/
MELFMHTQGAFGELVTDEKWHCKPQTEEDANIWYSLTYTMDWSEASIVDNNYYFKLVDKVSRGASVIWSKEVQSKVWCRREIRELELSIAGNCVI